MTTSPALEKASEYPTIEECRQNRINMLREVCPSALPYITYADKDDEPKNERLFNWKEGFNHVLNMLWGKTHPSLPSGGDIARYRELAIQRITYTHDEYGIAKLAAALHLTQQALAEAADKLAAAPSPATAALGTQEGGRFSDAEKIAAILIAGGHYYHAETVRLLASHARTIEALRAGLDGIENRALHWARTFANSPDTEARWMAIVRHARALKEHPNG